MRRVDARPQQQHGERQQADREVGPVRSWATRQGDRLHALDEVLRHLAGSASPSKSLSCSVAITTAMPAVKPVVTG